MWICNVDFLPSFCCCCDPLQKLMNPLGKGGGDEGGWDGGGGGRVGFGTKGDELSHSLIHIWAINKEKRALYTCTLHVSRELYEIGSA